jgi:hypothetical protein
MIKMDVQERQQERTDLFKRDIMYTLCEGCPPVFYTPNHRETTVMTEPVSLNEFSKAPIKTHVEKIPYRDYTDYQQERLVRDLYMLMDIHRLMRIKTKDNTPSDPKIVTQNQNPIWTSLLFHLQNIDRKLDQWISVWMTQFKIRQTRERIEHGFVPQYPTSLWLHQEWKMSKVFDKKEYRESSLFSWVHFLRSCLATVLEDDLMCMNDAVFKHELFGVLRQSLEEYQQFLKKWQTEHDPDVDKVKYKLLRLIRPFTHYLPCLSFFFMKTVEKSEWIRLLLFHTRQSLRMCQHVAFNLCLDGFDEHAHAFYDSFDKLRAGYYSFRNECTASGLQGLGNQEWVIEYDECLPMHFRNDMVDTGGRSPPQRQLVKNFILLHLFQRMLFLDAILELYPLNHLLRIHMEAFCRIHKTIYNSIFDCNLATNFDTKMGGKHD